MFKDLNDEILGDAIIVRSKQLFIDDKDDGELIVRESSGPVSVSGNKRSRLGLRVSASLEPILITQNCET